MEQKNNYTIIITEKPDAARRIAEALAESNTLKIHKNEYGVTYYEFIRNGKKFLVVCAVGHLFNLAPIEKKWIYPIFDYVWKPSFQVRRESAFSKKYFDTIKSVLKNGSEYIIATDYDIEGEVIGANILKFLVNKNDAKRMKYSTLTKDEIIESFENILPHCDFGQLESGLARHELDWLWGINLTRALTLALKNYNQRGFNILSTGRIQGPLLKILVDRELEIKSFIPKPFWELLLHIEINGEKFIAQYEKAKFWQKEEAEKIIKICEEKEAIVENVRKKKYEQLPPFPFNTTDLQAESYAHFKLSPTQTLGIAENLYTQGYISYPRSSVDYEEPIFIIDEKNRIKEVKIGEFIDKIMENENEKISIYGNSEKVNVNGFKTFSVNLTTNKIEVKPISAVIRHPINEELLEILTEDGRRVKITKGHSIFVFDGEKLKSIPTSQIKIGDYIAIAKNIPFVSKLEELNLIEEDLNKNLENCFILPNWKINKNLLNESYASTENYPDYRFRNSILLLKALKINNWQHWQPEIKMRAYKGKNVISLNTKQKITLSLARLLGYFVSEGISWSRIGPKFSYEVNLTQKDVDVFNDMKKCMIELLGIENLHINTKNGISRIRIYGKSIFYLFRLLGAKGNKFNRKVPDIILSANEQIIGEFLKGYFAGSSFVDIYARSISVRTASKNLANGVLFLLLRLGIFGKVYKIRSEKIKERKNEIYKIDILGYENIKKFYEKIGFVKKSHIKRIKKILRMRKLDSTTHINMIDRKLVNQRELTKGIFNIIRNYTAVNSAKYITLSQLEKNSNIKTNECVQKLLNFLKTDVGLSKVVSIKKIKPTNKYVYDLSIAGENFENFIGGFGGIILHNSSQKLPPIIDYKKIINALASLPQYEKICEELLKKEKLIPHEGPHIDPAHPCIYPTHEVPDISKLSIQEKKIYDLIVRRTLSSFANPAIRESMNIVLDINGNKFNLNGKRTIDLGWIKIYSPYVKFEEQLLPELKIGQKIKILKLELLEKQTQPPVRYSQGSIIKELEKRNLGTKCITGDTIIPIINGYRIHEIKIEELFNGEKSYDYENEKFLLNSDNFCFCVKDGNLTISEFDLISRRKLSKNEKVYEIVFEDGSKMKLTEDHPVLTYKNDFFYLPAKKLSKGMKVVSSFLFYDKFGDLISWEDFVKKLNRKSKLYGYANLKEWRERKSMTQKELGEILNVRQSTIACWENKMLLPLWVWSKIDLPKPMIIYSINKKAALQNPFPLIFSSALVRILAHLIGKGSLNNKKLKKENCFDFRYTNKNLDLIKLFITDLQKIFKINEKIKEKVDKRDKNKFYVQLPAIIGRILGILFKNLISKEIDIDEKFYPDFIGAIFDDEGHVYKNEAKIFISNTNIYIIKNLEKYLKKLGFTPLIKEDNSIYKKKNRSKSYKIFLYGRDLAKFLEEIPFFHRIKKERIIKNLTENYHFQGQPYLLLEKKVLSSLQKDGATLREISSIINLPLNTLKTCIKNLRKYKYVDLKIVGIHEQPRKKIIYLPTKECYKTFYSLLGEEVISPTLITKTIKDIKEIKYDGYVYDVINTLTSNFILGNGVVIHNSTRAEILQTLYDRGYIQGKAIRVNKIGEAVIKALEENCPEILSEELTRHFEKEMELIFNSKKKREEVIEEVKKSLETILRKFKDNEKKIGEKLLEGLIETRKEERKLGNCPNCKNGELRIIRSRKTMKFFVGCSNYPNCKIGYPLPSGVKIQATGKICEKCNTPIIQVWRKGKRPFRMCLDPNCETKKEWNKKT